jgi:hypothetical protein
MVVIVKEELCSKEENNWRAHEGSQVQKVLDWLGQLEWLLPVGACAKA